MEKKYLEELKKELSKLSEEEKIKHDLYLRDLAIGKIQGPPTGYPSIDKPWLSNYPEFLFLQKKTSNKILDRIKSVWQDNEEIIINYYDTKITAGEFFSTIEKVAKSLTVLGIKKGDSIIASLESVPEFLELFFASEIIGCSIKNYLGDNKSLINLINSNKTIRYYIAHDYLSDFFADSIYNSTNIENIIIINPLFSINDKNKIRTNILETINEKYLDCKSVNDKNIQWSDFLNLGSKINTLPQNDIKDMKLFSAFTSGTTGEPKEVIHSSKSILGIIDQLSLFPSNSKERDSWLLTILPPTLVAVVVAMMCYPLADGKKLILDPYCKVEDIDIEMMHYRPDCWGLIPIFFDILIDSKRIPKDYDMSYFKLFGFGAEPMTTKFIKKVQTFLNNHNCGAPFSSGYGQSEGGSDFTIAIGEKMLLSGSSGIPLINTTISIFEPNSSNELKYYEIGEICKSGPGIMLGYSDQAQTNSVLRIHPDGNLWLHTGDYGFMTSEGLLFVLGRKGIKVYPNKNVFPLNIENKISLIDGVKEAIIVSGSDKENQGFEVPYLFIVPEKDISISKLLTNIKFLIDKELQKEEKPKEIFLIDKKPIKKFKTDRKSLQKKYKLI